MSESINPRMRAALDALARAVDQHNDTVAFNKKAAAAEALLRPVANMAIEMVGSRAVAAALVAGLGSLLVSLNSTERAAVWATLSVLAGSAAQAPGDFAQVADGAAGVVTPPSDSTPCAHDLVKHVTGLAPGMGLCARCGAIVGPVPGLDTPF